MRTPDQAFPRNCWKRRNVLSSFQERTSRFHIWRCYGKGLATCRSHPWLECTDVSSCREGASASRLAALSPTW